MYCVCCKSVAMCVALALAASGCTSTFKSHPDRVTGVLDALDLEAEAFVKVVEKEIGKNIEGNNKILYCLELGRAYQLRGDHAESRRYFAAAMATLEAADEVGVVLVNDTVSAYKGYGFERVMLHQGQLLNYLALGDFEAALVEARRIIEVQDMALARHQAELSLLDAAAEEEMEKKTEVEKKGIYELRMAFEKSFAERLAVMDEATAGVKNSFQNAAAYYACGVVEQVAGNWDAAYLDYYRAFELAPDNTFILNDLGRLRDKVERPDDRLAARLADAPQLTAPQAGQGELVLLFDDGLMPARQETKIVLPKNYLNMSSVAFATYPTLPPDTALTLQVDGLRLDSQLLCNLQVLAVKNLREQVPGMVTRQVLRIVAMEAMAQTAENKGGLGKVAAGEFNVVSEKADLRAWKSLPARVQLLRTPLDAGTRRIHVAHPAAQALSLDIPVAEGGVTLVQIVRIGGRLRAAAYLLGDEGAALVAASAVN